MFMAKHNKRLGEQWLTLSSVSLEFVCLNPHMSGYHLLIDLGFLVNPAHNW